MNNFKKRLSVIVLSLILVVASSSASLACTSIFAGKDATSNDSVLISRNEDYSSAWAKHFKVFERKTNEKGATHTFYNGLEVDLPETSLKYFATPDWDPSYGPFKEAGINENNVAISSTNTHSVKDKVLEADPLIDEGIGETHIPSLILPRATSARQAVNYFGEMIEKHGSMNGYGFAIADEDEVWYIEVGSGHHWAAVRVPDDKYIVVANQFRLKSIDFDDEDYLYSDGLESFVYDNELLKENEEFDFAKAFGKLGEKYNTRREWWGQETFTPSLDQTATLDRYPVFVKPDEEIKPKEVMNFLRSDYDGTKYDTDKESGKDERAVGIDRTVESHVIQIRKNMPAELQGVMWLSIANPEYGVYLPFYTGIEKTLENYHKGTNKYDDESAYWAFRSAGALASENEELYGQGVKDFWNDYENNLLKEIDVVDETAEKLYEKDKDLAIDFITRYNNMTAKDAIEKAHSIKEEIITNFAGNNTEKYVPSIK